MQETKAEKEQLEAALRRTSPEWNSGNQEKKPRSSSGQRGPIQLYSMKGPIDMTPESAAESIALDCQTNFVSGSHLDTSMLNKLAEEAYRKVLAQFGKTSPIVPAEQRILDGMGQIMKQFEQTRLGPGRTYF